MPIFSPLWSHIFQTNWTQNKTQQGQKKYTWVVTTQLPAMSASCGTEAPLWSPVCPHSIPPDYMQVWSLTKFLFCSFFAISTFSGPTEVKSGHETVESLEIEEMDKSSVSPKWWWCIVCHFSKRNFKWIATKIQFLTRPDWRKPCLKLYDLSICLMMRAFSTSMVT